MGYPADQATIQAEADRLALESQNQAVNPMSHNYINNKKQVAQTKEEQEALISKLSTYAKRVDN